MTGPGVHAEHEDHGWTIAIPDHPGRTESPEFRRAKETMHKILAALAGDASAPSGLLRLIAGEAGTA